jgi:NADPH-dependent 2,4-dienoyl-CoA reductase/sulfur reductase-like enzyme
MHKKRLIVIGGNAAGMSAASQARRHGPDMDIIVLERGNFISYSLCGLPYYIADLVKEIESLVIRKAEVFRKKMGMDIRTQHEVIRIDTPGRRVRVRRAETGEQFWESFDHLMIATGAKPRRPAFLPTRLDGLFFVNSMPEGIAVKHFLAQNRIKRAIVVGGGYIGLEMAEALLMRHLEVTLIESSPQVMGTMDADMAEPISEAIIERGILLYTGETLQEIEQQNGRVTGVITDQRRLPADMVILGLGVYPDSQLAKEAGLTLGVKNAIQVNDHMQTSIEGIWAGGDCVESHDLILQQPVYIALGTVANKHGRIAGLNIAGSNVSFPGVIGTAITKFFDLEISRTGLTEKQLQAHDVTFVAGKIKTYSHAAYYPGAQRMRVKILAEKNSGRLLGAQIVGKTGAGKRIDTLATAIHAGFTLDELIHLDLSYAPPFSLAWDPIVIAARDARKHLLTE